MNIMVESIPRPTSGTIRVGSSMVSSTRVVPRRDFLRRESKRITFMRVTLEDVKGVH